MIRSAWALAVGLVLTVLYSSEITLWRLLRLPGLGHRCRDRPRRWSRAILCAAGVDVQLEGMEHFQGGQPRILVANHQSWFDILVLAGHLPVDYRFVAKKELARIPLFGPAWRACGHVAIDRQDRSNAIGALYEAVRDVGEGSPTVIIFPEGTRSRDGTLQPFKKGAFVLAIQAGMPIVPVAIVGSGDVMPKGSFRVRSGIIRVRAAGPIPVEGLRHEDRNQLALKARGEVARLMTGDDTAAPDEGGGSSPSEH